MVAALALASADGAHAQKFNRGPSSNIGVSRPPGGPDGPSRGGGGFHGGGFG